MRSWRDAVIACMGRSCTMACAIFFDIPRCELLGSTVRTQADFHARVTISYFKISIALFRDMQAPARSCRKLKRKTLPQIGVITGSFSKQIKAFLLDNARVELRLLTPFEMTSAVRNAFATGVVAVQAYCFQLQAAWQL